MQVRSKALLLALGLSALVLLSAVPAAEASRSGRTLTQWSDWGSTWSGWGWGGWGWAQPDPSPSKWTCGALSGRGAISHLACEHLCMLPASHDVAHSSGIQCLPCWLVSQGN